jgi:hypothetical protein
MQLKVKAEQKGRRLENAWQHSRLRQNQRGHHHHDKGADAPPQAANQCKMQKKKTWKEGAINTPKRERNVSGVTGQQGKNRHLHTGYKVFSNINSGR